MNKVDFDFYELVNKIKNMSVDEIFFNIKKCFAKVHPDTQKSIQNFLNELNYWGTLDVLNNDYTEIYEKAKSLKEHIDDYVWLYNKLNDYSSKKLLFAILNNWYCYDFKNLSESMSKTFPHYFDLDLIPSFEDKVFVDVGAYTGDTTLDFIDTYKKYKKIYCYEMTTESMATVKENLNKYDNIVYLNKAVSNNNRIGYFTNELIDASTNKLINNGNVEVEIVSLDNDLLEKVDMIKMDIEGEEYNALLGCKNHIVNDKPILLISVYHNNEDLWKLPKLIDEFNGEYKFYLRNYGNNIFPTEIVLIALPI